MGDRERYKLFINLRHTKAISLKISFLPRQRPLAGKVCSARRLSCLDLSVSVCPEFWTQITNVVLQRSQNPALPQGLSADATRRDEQRRDAHYKYNIQPSSSSYRRTKLTLFSLRIKSPYNGTVLSI